MNPTAFEQHCRESFFAQIRRQMKGLYRLVRHQLALWIGWRSDSRRIGAGRYSRHRAAARLP
jgi:hypothetical protein